jgi:hypothetical protein
MHDAERLVSSRGEWAGGPAWCFNPTRRSSFIYMTLASVGATKTSLGTGRA